MNLNDIFTRQVITAEPDDTLADVAALMEDRNVGDVVIVEDARPVGIITDRDLALALGVRGASVVDPVEKVMTRHIVAVPEDASIFTATQFIRECGVRRLPIVDRTDRLVGMVSMDDLLRCLTHELFNMVKGIEHEVSVR